MKKKKILIPWRFCSWAHCGLGVMLNPCQDGLGTYLEKNCPNGLFLPRTDHYDERDDDDIGDTDDHWSTWLWWYRSRLTCTILCSEQWESRGWGGETYAKSNQILLILFFYWQYIFQHWRVFITLVSGCCRRKVFLKVEAFVALDNSPLLPPHPQTWT